MQLRATQINKWSQGNSLSLYFKTLFYTLSGSTQDMEINSNKSIKAWNKFSMILFTANMYKDKGHVYGF